MISRIEVFGVCFQFEVSWHAALWLVFCVLHRGVPALDHISTGSLLILYVLPISTGLDATECFQMI